MTSKQLSCPIQLGKECEFLEIAPARPEELDSSVNFISDAFPHINIPAFFWRSKLERDPTFLLKENGDDVIGIVNVRKTRSMASLDLIAVRNDHQGKGIGTLLLKEAENIASAMGSKKVRLMTEQIKPRNVAFYSKNDYMVTDYDPHGYQHSPSVHFEKKLK